MEQWHWLCQLKEYAQAEDAAMGLKVSMMDATGKVAPEFEKINALAERLGTSLPVRPLNL